MPELPDVDVYVEAIAARTSGRPVVAAHVASPFLLRSVDPPLSAAVGRRVLGVRRLGKRVVLTLEDDLHLVFHLMIAGRLHWLPHPREPRRPGKRALAWLTFAPGTLFLTEAGTRKRASLHVLGSAAALAALDPGGLEPLTSTPAELAEALQREPHTLKRALTDPRLVAGIGNAYSDEILHHARLSPFKLTRSLTAEEMERLHTATVATLCDWTERLRRAAAGAFPERVTAFRPGMAVHGRYRQPCPDCGAPVQRIVYAENEANYCARCQTGGRVLADRALSRLLKDDWPRTLDELEARTSPGTDGTRAMAGWSPQPRDTNRDRSRPDRPIIARPREFRAPPRR